MKYIKHLLVVLLFVLTGFSPAQAVNWKVDPAHSKVQFTVSHMVISEVTGYFKKFDAKVTGTNNDLSDANIDFTIDVNSIDTDNPTRDNHLKSDDFFNAGKFPQIEFKGSSLTKVGDNKYKLKGNFTMRDITKPVELDVVYGGTVKDPSGKTRSGFKISGSLNRLDYNLKWNKLLETGGAVVGREVNILCNMEFVKEG